MLILGATGPLDAAKRRPWIEWIHTTIDQGSMVQVLPNGTISPPLRGCGQSIRRGVTLTNTAPSGPVYINLDVTIQNRK